MFAVLVMLFVLFAVAMIVAVIAGITSGIQQGKSIRATRQSSVQGKKFNHPTKANTNPIPVNPRFYNIGAANYHTSKECKKFSMLSAWDAITEREAISMGLKVCPFCKEPIVFVYPQGKVYHKTSFCSDSRSIPTQISESRARARGLHRCRKCW